MASRIRLSSPIRRLLPTIPGWPAAVHDLQEPPRELYVAGTLPTLTHAIAIVGTRYASEEALQFTFMLSRELARAGAPVVSGGAAGIDAAAHRGALEGGGNTLAVLATGLVDAYPNSHAGLFAEIARTGGLLCESDRNLGRAGWAFLRRNRLIAALAAAVVVVQAPRRSGALSTARWARSLKRRLLVVPASPWDVRGQGCVELLRNGAEICTSAADILSVAEVGLSGRVRALGKQVKQANDYKDLAASERRVWQKVRRGACHPDALGAALDMPAAEVQEALLSLVLLGMCRQRADGSYVSSDS